MNKEQKIVGEAIVNIALAYYESTLSKCDKNDLTVYCVRDAAKDGKLGDMIYYNSKVTQNNEEIPLSEADIGEIEVIKCNGREDPDLGRHDGETLKLKDINDKDTYYMTINMPGIEFLYLGRFSHTAEVEIDGGKVEYVSFINRYWIITYLRYYNYTQQYLWNYLKINHTNLYNKWTSWDSTDHFSYYRRTDYEEDYYGYFDDVLYADSSICRWLLHHNK